MLVARPAHVCAGAGSNRSSRVAEKSVSQRSKSSAPSPPTAACRAGGEPRSLRWNSPVPNSTLRQNVFMRDKWGVQSFTCRAKMGPRTAS